MLPLFKELIFVTVLLFAVPFVVMSVLVFFIRRFHGVDEYGRALHKPRWFVLLNAALDRLVPFLVTVYWAVWSVRAVVHFLHQR
jgi:hypothetical protein